MAKLPLDLSKFKKVGGDKETTTLRHSDGHEIKLAHGALSPKVRGQLASLPMLADQRTAKAEPVKMMAEGGDEAQAPSVDAEGVPLSVTPNIDASSLIPKQFEQPQAVKFQPQDMFGVSPEQQAQMAEAAAPAPNPLNSVPPQELAGAAQAAKSEIAQGVSQSAAAAAPEGMGSPAKPADLSPPDPHEGHNLELKGIQDLAAAQSAAMTAQREVAEQAANAEARAAQTFKDDYHGLLAENDSLMNDIKNFHIDPNRYIGSMETDQKIMTGIGLILGGISSGMTGKSNPALDFINNQISRDIEAQKATLGQKQSLLSANLQRFGNMRDAAQMTHMQMSSIYAEKMKAAALKSGDKDAIARSEINAGQLISRDMPAMMQFSVRQSLMKNGTMGVDPAKLIPFVVPEHERAAAYKEAGEAKAMMKAKDNVISAFNQIRELNTMGNRLMDPIQTASRIAAIRDPLIASLSKETAGRFTDSDAKMLATLFPSSIDDDKTAIIKLNRIERMMGEKMNFPVLSGNNLDPLQMQGHNSGMAASAPSSSMPPDHSAAIKWAQANPNSPYAAQVLHKAKILGY